MVLSTSHSETTSTGATWIRRNRSHLPYQPQPIRPTRFGVSAARAAARLAVVVERNRRRSMVIYYIRCGGRWRFTLTERRDEWACAVASAVYMPSVRKRLETLERSNR